MSFHVGQRVVCVDDAWRVKEAKRGWFGRFGAYKRLPHSLIAKEIYTVTGIAQLECDESGEIYECVFVAEGRHLFGAGHIPFPAFQFRALLERKTDVSFAHEILLKVSRKQTERA